MQTILYLLVFAALAFASGMFYPVFYAIIGSPALVPHPEAQEFEQAQILGISRPGMIFRRYGIWLCRKQNEWAEKHDKARIHFASVPKANANQDLRVDVQTSYMRSIAQIKHNYISANAAVIIEAHLLPGESALVRYWDERNTEWEGTIVLKPKHPTFTPEQIPLSPFKALGLCPACTVFWFMAMTMLSAVCLHILPASYPASFLLLPAYGIAIWGAQLYEL